MSDDRVQRALQDLQKEQDRVERLRDDYRVLSRSRFYALRMLWLSFKAMIGGSAVRAPFMAAATVGVPSPALHGSYDQIEPSEVIELWRSHVPPNPTGSATVSVIIPVFNHLNDTLRCLRSVALTWPKTISAEIVIVDDASTDQSPQVLSEIPHLRYIRNPQNLGFVRTCNAGAASAAGKYLCFLNNDTVVRNGWLDHLVSTLERDAGVGAVGAKLIFPNGSLQEAGAIIWRDGTGWNYGRNGDPSDSRYNYERDVDYCSGAALLVRQDAFASLGGFSEDFAPAYYEDADLCFALRAAGLRVVYQPRAEVVHYEGVTSGTSIAYGIKRYQELNRPKFVSKWQSQLNEHYHSDSANVPIAARRLISKPTVLIIDSYVPVHDREAGSNRLMHIVRILRRSGFGVVFLPDNFAALQPYTDQLQALGVEVLYHSEIGATRAGALAETLGRVDYAWICRPELYEKYAPIVRKHSRAKIVYDTIDLHFIRKQRESSVLGNVTNEASQYERAELSAARTADATVAISEIERCVLRERGITNVHVVPTIHHRAIEAPRNFDRSSGILFIGNYNHSPNVDAAEWLAHEIMPLVWKRLPDATVTLLGSNPTKKIRALSAGRINVTGYVQNVEPYFMNARVFVAPLRFGAGLKGKVGQAMAFGLPMVLSDVAAEGFGLTHDAHCVIANGAQAIASGIVTLYEDAHLWSRFSRDALFALEPFSSDVVQHQITGVFESLTGTAEALRA